MLLCFQNSEGLHIPTVKENRYVLQQRNTMDPDATWLLLKDVLHKLGERPDDQTLRDEAVGLLDALADWLRRGGFPPTYARE
jgi:hypothetical protein